jgi:hypothetical protein
LENRQASAAVAASSFDVAESAALRFGKHQDALDFARRTHEESVNILAATRLDFVERYRKGRANIVVQVLSDQGAAEYDLIFGAFVTRIDGSDIASAAVVVKGNGASTDVDGDQLFMPVVTELVYGPEGVATSLVWLERTKERHDIIRDIAANPAACDEVIEFIDAVGDRELRPLRVGFLAPGNGGSVAGLVKCETEGLQGFRRQHGAPFRQPLTECEFQKLVASIIRINLSDQFVWLTRKECPNLPFHVGNVFVASREAAACAIKRAVSIRDDEHEQARSNERPGISEGGPPLPGDATAAA